MKTPRDRHYPLGFVQGATEITDVFGAEAEAIGVITILWNRHELRLKSIFASILEPLADFAVAAWESENTHSGRMKLLRLAREAVPMSETRKALLTGIIDRTAALSEKRNALAHAEYVVNMDSDTLLARTHRRLKPPIYHPSDLESLNAIIQGLREVEAYCEALTLEFIPDDLKQSVAAAVAEVRAAKAARSPEG